MLDGYSSSSLEARFRQLQENIIDARSQLTQNHRRQRLLAQRVSQFVLKTDIPIDLEAELDDIETLIQDLNTRIGRMERQKELLIQEACIQIETNQANRKQEIMVAASILNNRSRVSTVMITADSGLGKTLLLDSYHRIFRDTGINCAYIDFGEPYTPPKNPIDFMMEVSARWGARFESFEYELNMLLTTTQQRGERSRRADERTFETNRLLNREPSFSDFYLRKLTSSWINDCREWLDSWQQAVLLIDTYDVYDVSVRSAKVSDDFNKWMMGMFLNAADQIAGLYTIVAGQNIPTSFPLWKMEHLTLKPLENPGDWVDYLERSGFIVTDTVRELVAELCKTHRGHPAAIRLSLGDLQN